MKPVQSSIYEIPKGSTRLLITKVSYKGDTYCKCIIEIFSKSMKIHFGKMKNVKLYYDKINHWKRIKSWE